MIILMNSQINNQHEKWKLNYFPPEGGKYSANLLIDNEELNILMLDNKNTKTIKIKKCEISSIVERGSLVNKSVTISIRGQIHKFTSYFMDTKKFIAGIK
ncbi:MAG: hypothetical protein C0596_09375 [Marinilabiliales bacterium]|mgnify:CR=1 FL=1|nr:MAG: hypothetical protein C0596_09375 [Marinilabiliales bacterium]